MGSGRGRECLWYPLGQLSFGENTLYLAHTLGQEFVKGKEEERSGAKEQGQEMRCR